MKSKMPKFEDKESLERIASILPANAVWFVAGGFAAMPARATDIDVWVRLTEPTDLSVYKEQLIEHLNGLESVVVRPLEDGRFTAPLIDNYEVVGEFTTYKVAMVNHYAIDLPIHLLLTTGDLFDVLCEFDVSTHQIAVEPNGHIVRGPKFTPINLHPVILRHTPTTTDRHIKITNRYADLRKDTV